jgi:sulfoquinovosyltransferase
MQGMSLLVVVVLNLLAVQYGYGYALRHGANAATSLRSRVSIKPLMAAEEEIPPLNQTAPLKLLCLVEPTPFNYISGYANRFQEAFKFMHKAGDEVKILTADQDPNPPTKFLDYTIDNNFGFRMPMYKAVVLSFDTKLETRRLIREMQPDILHVTSPSAFIWAAAFWSWRYKLPLIMSYHTNLRAYGTAYLPVPGIEKFADFLVWLLHSRADMTITTSDILKEQLDSIPIPNVRVWKKGINTEVFHPKFKNADMKVKLSDGHPEAPLLIYVGRLGFEKQLHKLKVS